MVEAHSKDKVDVIYKPKTHFSSAALKTVMKDINV